MHRLLPAAVCIAGTLLGVFAFAPVCALASTAPSLYAQAAPSAAPTPEYATALEPEQIGPGAFTPAHADLALTPENERKAEALAHFAEGILYEGEAEMERALEAYQAVLQRDPGQVELAVKIAYEFTRRGDVPKAIGILKDALKAKPGEQLPYLQLAYLYSRYLKKPEAAINYATQGLEADPKNLAAYQTLYEIYAGNGQTTKAMQVLERAAKIKTDDAEFWLRLADLHARLLLKEDGSTPEADVKKVGAIYQKALDADPTNPLILNRVADFHVATDDVKQAIPLYMKVLEHESKAPENLVPNVQEKLARSFLASGQREEAIAVLEEMVKTNPLRFEAYEFLGQLHEQGGDLERALNAYRQALLLSPNVPGNYFRVAQLQAKAGDMDKSIETLEEARRKFPNIPKLSYYLALTYSQAKRHDEALTTFEETLQEAEATGEETVNGEFYFNYGAAAEQAGLIEKAAELFQKAIELDPANSAQALNYLGYMWVDRNINLDEAGEMIRKALEFEPNNGAYIDSLGWYYYRKGEFEKALTELFRATELIEEEDPVVFDHIGDTYQALGNISQALIYWTKALVLDPKNEKIAEKVEGAKKQVTSGTAPAP